MSEIDDLTETIKIERELSNEWFVIKQQTVPQKYILSEFEVFVLRKLAEIKYEQQKHIFLEHGNRQI